MAKPSALYIQENGYLSSLMCAASMESGTASMEAAVPREDCKVEVPQVYHVARQHAQLVAAVIKEAQNAENKRMKRFSRARSVQERDSLEKRFAAEREADQDRIARFVEDGQTLVHAVAAKTAHKGAEGKGSPGRRRRPRSYHGPTRVIESDQNTLTFMKECFKKLNDPHLRMPPKDRHVRKIHPHDQPGYLRPVTHVTDERRNLLLAKRELLHNMHEVVLREERLLRAFGSVSPGSTRRSLPVSDSCLPTSSSSSMSRCHSPARTSVSGATSSSMATFYTSAHNTRFADSKPQRKPAMGLPRLPIAAR